VSGFCFINFQRCNIKRQSGIQDAGMRLFGITAMRLDQPVIFGSYSYQIYLQKARK